VTLPAAVPQLHVIEVVPCPPVITALFGAVHNCVTPVTVGVVKFTPTWLGHTDAGPDMLAGMAGRRVSDALRVAEPPHALTTCTLSVPVVKVLGIFRTIELPLFVAIEHPDGTVQLYAVAALTAVMEYVNCPPPHKLDVGPVIADNVAGFLLKPSVRAALCPHALVATTDNVPLLKEELTVSVMLLVPWPDDIVVLVGAVQV
jgi:hypothetical protein